MKEIKLVPQKLTYEMLEMLQERGLVMMLQPTNRIDADIHADTVDTMYSSEPEFGSHKVICVRKNAIDIEFAVHAESEEVIFINNTGRPFKPLYLIFGLDSCDVFESKLKAGTVVCDDVIALEVDYNDPKTCMFTVLKGVPHYEVTIPGDGEAPIFYVTEPTDIDMRILDRGANIFSLDVL